MTAAAPRNGFAKPRHRMSLWSAVKKLIARLLLSQQSSNVLFGQSRNVLLTGSSLEGGRRTTADDPGRASRYWPFPPKRGLGLLTESADELEVGDIWLPG